jgi:hypothetical protein
VNIGLEGEGGVDAAGEADWAFASRTAASAAETLIEAIRYVVLRVATSKSAFYFGLCRSYNISKKRNLGVPSHPLFSRQLGSAFWGRII